ncbi:hypothetical protein BDQ17DRAFT_1242194 [Cyathus striatus]|nr:hypothetical protein BDQ17DRAFT_1242194 [Cyathus striatus]
MGIGATRSRSENTIFVSILYLISFPRLRLLRESGPGNGNHTHSHVLLPPARPRRLSTASAATRQGDLINAYEAEEERIINILSRKLEKLREEKIDLENALEAENESHVNKLSRELSALRLAQQQHQQQQLNPTNGIGSNGYTSPSVSPDTRVGFRSFMMARPNEPSSEAMLEAMRRENEQLRNRLVDTERDYIRIMRLNEIYREELIEHRRRLGLPVDSLIGLSSSDPYSQPTHHRSSSSVSSPSTSMYVPTPMRAAHAQAVPIPRPPSQIHRPVNNTSESSTPLSRSPSSYVESPFPFSPVTTNASYVSALTSPPSSMSLGNQQMLATPARGLTYPSVPPPSLSSSFGSPVSYMHSHSPQQSRRNSHVVENGTFHRRASVDRGGRVAESGTLVPRSRAGSTSATSQQTQVPRSGLEPTREAAEASAVDEASAGVKIDIAD